MNRQQTAVSSAGLAWLLSGAVIASAGCRDDVVPACLNFPEALQEIDLVEAFPGLEAFSQPVMMAPVPGSPGRWLVVQRTGELLSFTDWERKPEIILDLSDRVAADGDAGFSAVAPDPDFANNHQLYLFYATSSEPVLSDGSGAWRARLSRFTEGSPVETVLLEIEEPEDSQMHANGDLQFGPDGALYLSLGDGGPQGDPEGRAQDLGLLQGKILRIEVDPASSSYTAPADNPFVGVAGARPEIWAYGLRNPWRFSFDTTGRVWAGDVGWATWEEINRVEAGDNLGWPMFEGPECLDEASCDRTDLVEPIVTQDHYAARAVVGGRFSRDRTTPTLEGQYVYADYQFGEIWAFGADFVPRVVNRDGYSFTSFAEDEDGSLMVVDIAAGRIWRLVDGVGEPGEDGLPARLSATGCVDPEAPKVKAESLYAYAINLPFWSDEASKTRWLGMPEGTKLTLAEDGDINLPAGAVLLKEFGLGDTLVETRIMAHHGDDRWTFVSYRWDEDQTDATLISAGAEVVDVAWGAESWHHPTRGMCRECHSNAPNVALGLELSQLDRRPVDRRLGNNQLKGLQELGMLGALPASIEPFPRIDDHAVPIDERARAWLHVNCSYCHRPNGRGRGDLDLRVTTSMDDALMCDKRPDFGELGVDGARIIRPGEPERSVLALRIAALDDDAMPPLARYTVDERGLALIQAWIAAMPEDGDCELQ